MAKLQHNFVRGRMNKDLDERLVPNGEYRDAQNIQVSTSEDSDVGAIENILGNTKKNLLSTGPDVFWDPIFGLTEAACIGAIRDSQNEKLYWFITGQNPSAGIYIDAILEFDQTTGIVAPVIVDSSGILNFSENYLITGVNILGGLMYWTDDRNEPRVLNIDRFKAGSVQPAQKLVQHTQVYGANFTAEDITVIVKSPNVKASVLAEPSLVGGNATGITPVFTTQLNFNTGSPTFKPVPPGTLYSAVSFSAPVSFDGIVEVLLTAQEVNESNIIENYEVVCSLSNISLSGLTGDLTVVSVSSNIPDKAIQWSMLLIEDEPIFKNDFPRFSYRWRYADGQYSTYAPFTKPAFVPNKFQYLSSDGFNAGMDNVTRKITLSSFQAPGAGVEYVDILYKGVNSNNVYVLETIDLSAGALTNFVITDELLGNVIESVQLLRLWDNVPKKAKSQEVIGNRIVYGNYLQNYNVNAAVDITAAQVNTTHTNIEYGLPSIKTDRTYQIGVSFIDAFNRESPVFTNGTASQVIQIGNSEKTNTLTAQLNSTPPSWATAFKYYVKEPSAEYYNLALDRFYDSEDGNVWLSFPSSERNKIQEGQYMLLKKQHDDIIPVKSLNRYKILDIRNEAPTYVSNQNSIVAQVQGKTLSSGSGFTVGEKEISFVAPSGRDAQEFYDLFNNQSSIQFTDGIYSSDIYPIISGGPGELNTSNLTQIFEVTLGKELLTKDAWLAGLSTSVPITIRLYNKNNQNLPEFQGRFFVKINKNQTFIDNVEVPFNNNTPSLIVQQDTAVETSSSIVDTGQSAAWTDPYQSTGPTFAAPTIGSADFTYTFAISVPSTGPFFDMIRGLQPGVKIRFYDTSNNFSSVYTILTASVPASGNLTGATYNRNNPPVGSSGFYSQITMTSVYTDLITPNGIQIVEDRIAEDVDVLSSTNPAVFETEPIDIADLDIYYEVGEALPIASAGAVNTLDWFNCYSFGNGVESDRVRDDFNAPQIGNGVRVSSTLERPYQEERKGTGLIFSGIFNSTTGINNTNQFLTAEDITKDLNPIYGSIQKLHARDTDLITLCEDKSFRILANKDALFNADGNTNVTSNKNVLGQAVPFAGEFGISKNPESFVSYGFRAYYADKARGAVIRLSRDGITEISEKGMSDFFQDGFKTQVKPILGMYDENSSSYNVSVGNELISFKENVDGWATRLTYQPEFGLSLNNEFYTFYNGELWEHTNETRSNFYGVQEDTTVTPIINDAPASVKNFKTLSYEGDEGWTAGVTTNKQEGQVNTWVEREGIYFNYISGVKSTWNNGTQTGTLDFREFSTQGIGNITTVDPPVAPGPYDLTMGQIINVSAQVHDRLFVKRASGDIDEIGKVISIDRPAKSIRVSDLFGGGNEPQGGEYVFVVKDEEKNTSGILGYYAETKLTTSSGDKKELFALNSEVFISSE